MHDRTSSPRTSIFFLQRFLKKNEKKLARSFNFTFRDIDYVLSLWWHDRIYPIELEIRDTTDPDWSALYLYIHLEIDSEGRLRTKLYDKRDDFNFPIVNFAFIWSNIPAAPAYGYIFLSWCDVPELGVPIRISLIEGCCLQGSYWNKGSYWLNWRHHFESVTVGTMIWLTSVKYLCRQWPGICFIFVSTSRSFPHLLHRLTRLVPLVEQKLLTLPEHMSSLRFLVGFVLLDLLFICMFCRSLFVLFYFFFWPLCCLFFFDIWILITPLVSSNSSCDTDISCKCQFVNIINQIKDIKWNLSNRHISDGVARPYTRVLILSN